MSYGENKLTKKREIFKNILSLEFISFTSETIFELLVLKSFDSHLIYNHASFKGFANSYNHFFDSFSIYINENSNKRCVLNRRRLSESWFYYKFIQYYNEFNGGLENFPMPFVKDLDVELNKINDLSKLFERAVVEKSNYESVRPLMKEIFLFSNLVLCQNLKNVVL